MPLWKSAPPQRTMSLVPASQLLAGESTAASDEAQAASTV